MITETLYQQYLALPQKDLLQNGHPITASFGVSQLQPNETSAGLINRI